MNRNIESIVEKIKDTGNFPILYRKGGKNNNVRYWSIKVVTFDDDTAAIDIKHGITGSDKSVSKRIPVKVGKNIGRRNETNPYEQAIKDAIGRFRTKYRSMTPDIKNIEEGFSRVFPMLAKDFHKIKPSSRTSISPPYYVQIKFDGDRCIANYDKSLDKVILRGRDLHVIKNMPHIEADMMKIYKRLGVDNSKGLYFDGELCKFGMSQQKINGIVNRRVNLDDPENIKRRKEIKFFIFDCYFSECPKKPFMERNAFLYKTLWKGKKDIYKNIVYVTSDIAKSDDELKILAKKVTDAGFEGIIIRSRYGKYKPASSKSSGRSSDIYKYKLSVVDKAKIIDMEIKKNVKPFGFVFVCEHEKTGKIFKINGIGTADQKKKTYAMKEQLRGSSYLRYTYVGEYKDGLPREAVPLMTANGEYEFEIVDEGDDDVIDINDDMMDDKNKLSGDYSDEDIY
jgi:ATP-dependent DNA ligase